MIRKKTRLWMLQEEPQRKELIVNKEMENKRYRFRPNTRLSHPDMGMIIALDTR
jgi:hypothetical protein